MLDGLISSKFKNDRFCILKVNFKLDFDKIQILSLTRSYSRISSKGTITNTFSSRNMLPVVVSSWRSNLFTISLETSTVNLEHVNITGRQHVNTETETTGSGTAWTRIMIGGLMHAKRLKNIQPSISKTINRIFRSAPKDPTQIHRI
jgi:hypothetical protein